MTKEKVEIIFDGGRVMNAHTIGSRYDANSITVYAGDLKKEYRIEAGQIAMMMEHFNFTEYPKRRYTYLELRNKKV